MVGTVAERKTGSSSFEFEKQVLLAEIAAIRVVKLNGLHLQRIEIEKLHPKAVFPCPLHSFHSLFRRNMRTFNREQFDGVPQILRSKTQETAVQAAGKSDCQSFVRCNLRKHLFKSGQTRVVNQSSFLRQK